MQLHVRVLLKAALFSLKSTLSASLCFALRCYMYVALVNILPFFPVMSASSDITLKLWDAKRGACTSTLRQQQDYIKCLAYARQREQVASGSLDHSIYVWDLKTLTSLTATNNKVTSKGGGGGGEGEREGGRERTMIALPYCVHACRGVYTCDNALCRLKPSKLASLSPSSQLLL